MYNHLNFSTFFFKRLLLSSIIGIFLCIFILLLIVPLSEKIYDFIPFLVITILSAGSFVSSRICTKNIKHSKSLLSLFCSLTILLSIWLVSVFVFHSFSLFRFLIKCFFVIIFGFLGSLKKTKIKRQKIVKRN